MVEGMLMRCLIQEHFGPAVKTALLNHFKLMCNQFMRDFAFVYPDMMTLEEDIGEQLLETA